MNRKEIRTKLLRRRKVLGLFFLIILSPILMPLLLINKIGEISEKIANIIQNPFLKIIENSIEKYKIELEEQLLQEKENTLEINIGKYEEAKNFNENLKKSIDKSIIK